MPPHSIAAGPICPAPFRRGSPGAAETYYVAPAAWSRACQLRAWRHVPRVGWRACRNSPTGLFCHFDSLMVVSVNCIRRVVLLDKNSKRRCGCCAGVRVVAGGKLQMGQRHVYMYGLWKVDMLGVLRTTVLFSFFDMLGFLRTPGLTNSFF